jgi:hypothetical protein
VGDDALVRLLPALDIAAFERSSDGSFFPVAPLPAWFTGLARETFPFLGHILEEAGAFWASGAQGVRQWGPCADVDDLGNEFHYLVKALTIELRTYLVFERDEGAERVREVLQKARSSALDAERERRQRGDSSGGDR